MIFNDHCNLEGLHAPFGASKSSWLRYDEKKAEEVYRNMQAAEYGTRLHAWAKETIDLGIRQQRSKRTLSSYVNDAIGYRMSTEVILYYSDRFFGTADAISFNNNLLRIHDLKTGSKPVHIEQLEIYAALFCLEYKQDPRKINYELRIYQNDEIFVYVPKPEEIIEIINKIVKLDDLLQKINKGGN